MLWQIVRQQRACRRGLSLLLTHQRHGAAAAAAAAAAQFAAPSLHSTVEAVIRPHLALQCLKTQQQHLAGFATATAAAAVAAAQASAATGALKPHPHRSNSRGAGVGAAGAAKEQRQEREAKAKYVQKIRSGKYNPLLHIPKAAAQRAGYTRLHLGCYSSQQEAALMVDAARVGLGLPPANNPDIDHSAHPLAQRLQRELQRGALGSGELQAAAREVLGLRENNKQHKTSTQYIGIFKTGTSFSVKVEHAGKSHKLGCYPDAEHAARVYDRAATRLWGAKATHNFPGQPPAELPAEMEAVMAETGLQGEELLQALANAARAAFKGRCTSRYTGVCWDKAAQTWAVFATCAGRTTYFGTFGDDEKAARTFDRAVLYRRHLGLAARHGHFNKTNFPEGEYEGDALLLQAKADGVSFAEFAARCRVAAKKKQGTGGSRTVELEGAR